MKNQAIKYAVMVFIQRLLGLLCFLLAAGTLSYWRGWVYFLTYILVSAAGVFMLLSGHQETLSARGEKYGNTKNWDKILLGIYVPLAFYGIYIVAGLEYRFGWSYVPLPLFWTGIALNAAASLLSIWPVYENKHFESTARIQNDRNQTVCESGPYRFVRHPGYAFIILWAISMPMIFGLFTGLVSCVIIAVIIIRTSLEDAMLKKELPGYSTYSKKVRYRLLPFIW